MGFQIDADDLVAASTQTKPSLFDEPAAPVAPYPPFAPTAKPDPSALLPWIDDEDPVKRAFGHPLGTNPGDGDIVDKVMKYGLDPLGKALGVALPIAEHYAPEVEHASPALGPVGIGISLLGAANEGRKLVNTVAEDGPDAIHDQRFYNADAGVASNSIHALLGIGSMIPSPAAPFLKGADAAISAVELGTDLAGGASELMFGEKGKFDSNSVEGALLRGMDGDKSLGYQTGEWTRQQLGPGAGSAIASTLVSMATNTVARPYNLANTAYHGITDYVSGIQDGVANGEGLLGWDLTHGKNALGLPADNPLLMTMGGNPLAAKHATAGLGASVAPARASLGGSVAPARAGLGGSVGRAPAGAGLGGGIGGGIGALGAGLGGSISGLLRHR